MSRYPQLTERLEEAFLERNVYVILEETFPSAIDALVKSLARNKQCCLLVSWVLQGIFSK